MKTTEKIEIVKGISIDKVKPYLPYVATLKLKKGEKVINKVVIFIKTKDGLFASSGWDENQAIYNKPIKISEKNNSIRLATKQDFYDFCKRQRMVSMK